MTCLTYIWLKDFYIFVECMFTTFLIKSDPLLETQETTIIEFFEKVYLFFFALSMNWTILYGIYLWHKLLENILMTSLIRLANSIIVNLCYIIERKIKLLHDHQLNDRSVFVPTFSQYEYRDIIFNCTKDKGWGKERMN